MKKTMNSKHNIRTKMIAATLAAISIFSTVSVSAADANMNSSGNNIPGTYFEQFLTENADTYEAEAPMDSEAERLLKKIADKLLDAGLDALGDAFPGGKVLSGILKFMIDEAKGEDDPIAELAKQEQEHFEELRDRVNDINTNMEKYSNKLELIVIVNGKRQTLSEAFTNLSKNLKDLTDKIKAINDSSSYTPVQKQLLIADLNFGGETNEKDYLGEVRQTADAISKTLKATGNLLDDDLYGTLIGLCTSNAMFKGEAYDLAKDNARALTEQFMYANTVLLECQNACRTLRFTDEQVQSLAGNRTLEDAYIRCMEEKNRNFQELKFKDTIERLEKGIDSFTNFENSKYEGNRFINQGKIQDEMIFDIDGTLIKGANSTAYKNLFSSYYFSKSEMTAFADHVRKIGGGKMSIYDYLKKNHQNIPVENVSYLNNRYIVVDPEIKETKDSTPCSYEWYSDFRNNHQAPVYKVRQTIKVINIYDPECKVQDLVVKEWENVHWTHPTKSGNRNYIEYTHAFFSMGAHKATDADNYKEETVIYLNGLELKLPKRSYTDDNVIRGPKIG